MNDKIVEFVKYVKSFYATGGVYGEYMFMTTEIVLAIGILIERYGFDNFEGDSVDRERVRDIVLDELR